MNARLLCCVLFFQLTLVVSLFGQEKPSKSFCLPDELEEVSGLVYQNADSLWWHNDSGSAPSIYLTNQEGELQQRIDLPFKNRDWEDITADTAGHLFIGDFGNNRRLEIVPTIYRYHPQSGHLDSINYTYSDSLHYDVEAFFWHQDSLHLFTKSPISKGWLATNHFVLPAQPGEQIAVLRNSLALKKRVVTGAAIDPLSGEVALVAYYYRKHLGFIPRSAASVFFFNNYVGNNFLAGDICRKRISFLVATQYESVDFVNDRYLLVASEKTVFIPAKAKRIKRVKK